MAKKEEKEETEKLLVENFVILQEKLLETLKELKELKENVKELVSIFNTAKEELKKGNFYSQKEIEKKLDKIIEQNKTIAEGIVALGESLQEKKQPPKEKERKKEKREEIEEEKEDYELEPLPEFNF